MAVNADELRGLLAEAGVRPELARAIDPAVPLLRQGLDSMDYPAFMALVEDRYGVVLSDAAAMDLRTLNDFVLFLGGRP